MFLRRTNVAETEERNYYYYYVITVIYKLFGYVNTYFVEECRLLECGAMWVYYNQTFRKNVSPLSSG
jgi:hypothetical protein